MKIYTLKLPGEVMKYFLHEDARTRYLVVLQECKDKGGNIVFETGTVEVDEREPIEIIPLFHDSGVTRVWDVEIVIFKGSISSCKVMESYDIIRGYSDPKEYTIAIPWLSRCTKGIAKSWISEDHAISLAKTAALEKYKEIMGDKDVPKSSEIHQDDTD